MNPSAAATSAANSFFRSSQHGRAVNVTGVGFISRLIASIPVEIQLKFRYFHSCVSGVLQDVTANSEDILRDLVVAIEWAGKRA